MDLLTHIKDLDHELMLRMEDESLLNFCKIENKYVYQLCNDENFWRNRTMKQFGTIFKIPNRKWKDFYLKLVYYKNKYTIFETVDKLNSNEKMYDIYNYFSNLVKDHIRKTMLAELRMDFEASGVSKTEQEKVIAFNRDNLEKPLTKFMEII